MPNVVAARKASEPSTTSAKSGWRRRVPPGARNSQGIIRPVAGRRTPISRCCASSSGLWGTPCLARYVGAARVKSGNGARRRARRLCVGDTGRDPYSEIPPAATEVGKVVVEGKLHAQRRMPLQKRCQGVQQGRGERGGGGHAHRTLDTDRCAETAGGRRKREGRTSDLGEEALTVGREGECSGRATEQACAVRGLEAADEAGDGGRVTPRRRAAPAKEPASATRRTTTAARRVSIAYSIHYVLSVATPFVLPCALLCPYLPGHQKRRVVNAHRDRGYRASGTNAGHRLGARGSRGVFRLARSSPSCRGGRGYSRARAATQEEAAAFGDVVLWTPRGVMPVDPDMLAGKVVTRPEQPWTRPRRRLRLAPPHGTEPRRAAPGSGASGARGESVQYRGDAVAAGKSRAATRVRAAGIPRRRRCGGKDGGFLSGGRHRTGLRWISEGWKRRGWQRRWPTHSAKPW